MINQFSLSFTPSLFTRCTWISTPMFIGHLTIYKTDLINKDLTDYFAKGVCMCWYETCSLQNMNVKYCNIFCPAVKNNNTASLKHWADAYPWLEAQNCKWCSSDLLVWKDLCNHSLTSSHLSETAWHNYWSLWSSSSCGNRWTII